MRWGGVPPRLYLIEGRGPGSLFPPTPEQWYFLQREQPGINKGLMGRILEGGSAVPMETDQFRGSHSHS